MTLNHGREVIGNMESDLKEKQRKITALKRQLRNESIAELKALDQAMDLITQRQTQIERCWWEEATAAHERSSDGSQAGGTRATRWVLDMAAIADRIAAEDSADGRLEREREEEKAKQMTHLDKVRVDQALRERWEEKYPQLVERDLGTMRRVMSMDIYENESGTFTMSKQRTFLGPKLLCGVPLDQKPFFEGFAQFAVGGMGSYRPGRKNSERNAGIKPGQPMLSPEIQQALQARADDKHGKEVRQVEKADKERGLRALLEGLQNNDGTRVLEPNQRITHAALNQMIQRYGDRAGNMAWQLPKATDRIDAKLDNLCEFARKLSAYDLPSVNSTASAANQVAVQALAVQAPLPRPQSSQADLAIHELQASTQALQASNREMQSSNREMQDQMQRLMNMVAHLAQDRKETPTAASEVTVEGQAAQSASPQEQPPSKRQRQDEEGNAVATRR
jgi:hypothetical protein